MAKCDFGIVNLKTCWSVVSFLNVLPAGYSQATAGTLHLMCFGANHYYVRGLEGLEEMIFFNDCFAGKGVGGGGGLNLCINIREA